jgi:hypothetical protein
MFETLQESGPLKFVLAFVLVLVLIGVVAWVIRRFGSERFGGAATRGRQPRLGVVDKVELGDGRRRLVIIRRDNIEHLLMIGGPTDVVVEQNIVRAMGAPRDKIEPTLGRTPVSENLARPVPLGEGNAIPLQPAPENNGRGMRNYPEESAQWTWPAQAEPQRPPAAEPPPPRPPRAEPRPEPRLEPKPEFKPDFRPEFRPEPKIEPRLEPRGDALSSLADDLAARPAPPREPASARPAPTVGTRPAPTPPAPSAPVFAAPVEKTEKERAPTDADQNFAEMANLLEASLRRAGEPRLPEPPAPPRNESMVPPVARMTPPEPRVTPPEQKPARTEAKPEPKPAAKTDFDTLEQEMASLLGRPPGKGG